MPWSGPHCQPRGLAQGMAWFNDLNTKPGHAMVRPTCQLHGLVQGMAWFIYLNTKIRPCHGQALIVSTARSKAWPGIYTLVLNQAMPWSGPGVHTRAHARAGHVHRVYT